jgi:hypothetical protein
LEATGWTVTNGSIGGNNTTLLNNRYDTDAVPVNPDVILIGLSLGNEGLLGDPDVAFESFRSGMTNLIHRSRTNGFYPVITHAYAHTAYDTNRYAYVKRMNLLLNSWNVPGVNLLGPLDDGAGKWVTAYRADDAHPNTAGHEEFFYAVVPTLFDAILAGKTNTPQPGRHTWICPPAGGGPAALLLHAVADHALLQLRIPLPCRDHRLARGGHDGHQRPARRLSRHVPG